MAGGKFRAGQFPLITLQKGFQVGYRLGGFAYVTDCNVIPPASMAALRGLDVLILDALRYRSHPTHFTVAEALAVAAELAPRRTILTHIAHDLDHAAASALLPPGVEIGYDGLVIDVSNGEVASPR